MNKLDRVQTRRGRVPRDNASVPARQQSDRPASIADVARCAGVSTATVSRVMNGRSDGFSESTAKRVMAAVNTAPEDFLNELFTVLTEVVFRHGGTVDKFIGDCVMAIFGAPSTQADHAARALACAEDMHRFVEASAPAWKARFGVECRLGVGINAGEALVGNLGSETRMEYTAIGDVVNVAARLEGLARPGQTLCTAEVAAAVDDTFTLAPLGEHPLRGKRQAVQILELQ